MAEASIKTADELFKKNGDVFFIPAYQRGYRWEPAEMRELLSDLFEFSLTKEGTYCLQPIVVKKIEDASNGSAVKWEVIDGQQRLTALWLLGVITNVEGYILHPFQLEYEGREHMRLFLDAVLNLMTQSKKAGSGCTVVPSVYESVAGQAPYAELDDIGSGADGAWPYLYQILSPHGPDESLIMRSLKAVLEFGAANDAGSLPDIEAFNGDEQEDLRAGLQYKLPKIKDRLEDVQLIWYELLGAEEDPVKTFMNINANKIELNDAELIKAKILRASELEDASKQVSSKRTIGASNVPQRYIRSVQWESIENRLHDDSFWYFIGGSPEFGNAARIEYLFRILSKMDKSSLADEQWGGHGLFRELEHRLKTQTVTEIWDEMLELTNTLEDWYNSKTDYHLVGLRIALEQKKAARSALVKRMYQQYRDSSRTEFQRALRTEIKDAVGLKAASTDEFDKQLRKLRYDGTTTSRNKIRRVLLAYNIALIVNSNVETEKFSFESFETNSIDIEHVNAQAPKSDSSSNSMLLQRKWLDERLPFLQEIAEHAEANRMGQKKRMEHVGQQTEVKPPAMTLRQITRLIEDVRRYEEHPNPSKFADLAGRVQEAILGVGVDAIDSIGNLVLLDASINRMYKNEPYSKKREAIVQALRATELEDNASNTPDHEGVFVPGGTRWVFLKEFEGTPEIIGQWTEKDMNDYVGHIVSQLWILYHHKTQKDIDDAKQAE